MLQKAHVSLDIHAIPISRSKLKKNVSCGNGMLSILEKWRLHRLLIAIPEALFIQCQPPVCVWQIQSAPENDFISLGGN
jgi:hypothetical protein